MTTTKKSLLALSLSIITTIVCMEKKESPRFIHVIKNPLAYSNHTIHLSGTIEIKKDALVGYGSEKCITALKEANIDTQLQWPLVPVDIFIPNPKKNAAETETYSNWTEETPLIITQEINNYISSQIKKEEDRIASLYGYEITPQNQTVWTQFHFLSESIYRNAKQAKDFIIPAVIPVHILFSPNIKINLFNCYETDLTFNQHEKLEKLIEQFFITPQAVFTMLDTDTTMNIKLLQTLLSQDNKTEAQRKLAKKFKEDIKTDLFLDLNMATQTLKNKDIINCQKPHSSSNDLHLVNPIVGMAIIKDHIHESNGCSKEQFRRLLLDNTPKNQNLVTFINNRTISNKK